MLNFFRNLNWAKIARVSLILVLLIGVAFATLNVIHRDERLRDAAYSGNLIKVRLYVLLGADINGKDNYQGRTSLHWAAYCGHTSVVKYLLSKDAYPGYRDNDYKTPFFIAKDSNHDNIATLFTFEGDIDYRYENGNTPLHEATMRGDLEKVKFLLNRGADINSRGFNGQSPLIDACENGQFEAAKFLIENGSDVNIQDKSHGDALHGAIFQAHLTKRNSEQSQGTAKEKYQQEYQQNKRIVGILLNAGARVNSGHLHLCLGFGIKGEIPNMLHRYAQDPETLILMEREDIKSYLQLEAISK